MLGACVQDALQLQLAELPGVHNRRRQAVKEGVCRIRELDVAATWYALWLGILRLFQHAKMRASVHFNTSGLSGSTFRHVKVHFL